MSDYKKLSVWRKAHGLMLNVHRSARRIRGSDNASLRSQMLRAALSVPANIVEGSGQSSRREFVRFLRIAFNSAGELGYHLIVAKDVGLIATNDFASLWAQNEEVRKMLYGLIKHVTTTTNSPGSPEGEVLQS